MSEKKCEHNHIIITTKCYYFIEEGYEKIIEKEDLDMENYEANIETITRCQDCGKILDENY